MRRALLVVALLVVPACHKEPAFDDRYDKAAKEIEARAKAMDAEIAAANKAAVDAGRADKAKALPPSGKPSNAPASSGE